MSENLGAINNMEASNIAAHAKDVPFLVDVINGDDTRAIQQACMALQNLAISKDDRSNLTSSPGGIAALVKVMGGSDDKAKDYACAAVCALSSEKAQRAAMVHEHPVVEGLVEAITTTASTSARLNACGALLNLAGAEENKPKLCNPQVVAALVSVAKSDTGTGQDNAFGALHALATAKPNQRAILTHSDDLLPAIAAALDPASSATDTARVFAARVLRSLAKPAESKPQIFQAESLLTSVISALDTSSGKLRELLAGAVYELGMCKDIKLAMANNSSLVAALLTTVDSDDDADTEVARQNGAGALYEIAANGEAAEILAGTEKMVDRINATVASPDREAMTKQFAAGVLYHLAIPEGSRAVLAAADSAKFLGAAVCADTADSVKLFACGALQRLALSPEQATHQLEIEGLVDGLVTTAGSSSGQLQQSAINLLFQLISLQQDKTRFAEGSFIESLINMYKAGGKAAEYAARTVQTIATSSTDDVRSKLIHNDSLIETVCTHLSDDDATVKDLACSTLVALTLAKGERAHMLTKVIGPVMEVLDSAVGKPLESLCSVLHNLSILEENKVPMQDDHKLFDRLLALVKKLEPQENTEKARELATGVMHSIAQADNVKVAEGIVARGGSAELLALAKRTAGTKGQRNALRALCALSGVTTVRPLMLSAVGPLLDLEKTIHDEATIGYVYRTLQYLANHDDNKVSMMAHNNLIPTVLNAMRKGNEDTREQCASILCDLSFAEENRVAILDLGVLEPLINILRTDTGKGRMYAGAALWALSIASENRTTMVESYPVIEALLEVLKVEQGKTTPLLQYSLLAMQHLAMEPDNQSLMVEEYNVVEAMISVFKVENAKGRGLACAVLRYLPVPQKLEAELTKALVDAGYQLPSADSRRNVAASMTDQPQQQEPDEEDELIANEMFRHCTAVMKELVSSEGVYVKALQDLNEYFEKPLLQLKNSVKLKIADIFRDVDPIRSTHAHLYEKLQNAIAEPPRDDWPLQIAATLTEMSPFLKQCSTFIEKFDQMMEQVDSLGKDKGCQKVFEQAKQFTNLNLQAHMIMPVQRIPRIELMLKDLLKNTNRNQREYKPLNQALENIKDVANFCNERKNEADTEFKLSSIALRVKNIPNDLNLMAANRRFEFEGRLRGIAPNGSRILTLNVYLFNDLLLLTTDNNVFGGDIQYYHAHMALTKGKIKTAEQLNQDELRTLSLRVSKPLRRRSFNVDLGFGVTCQNNRRIMFAHHAQEKANWLNKLKAVNKGK